MSRFPRLSTTTPAICGCVFQFRFTGAWPAKPGADCTSRSVTTRAPVGPAAPRTIQAAIHAAWCRRRSLAEPAPWPEVLALYDLLLTRRDDPIVRLNRAVALAEIAGVPAALHELEVLDAPALASFLPYHAARADLLRRTGRAEDARAAYAVALALDPPPAERMWLERRMR